MSTVEKLKREVGEEEQNKKATKSEEEESPFYLNVLFWVRVGVAIIFLMVIITYFFFSG